MQTIEGGNFEDIEKLVTPRGLQNYKCNTLLISMKVRINSKILLNLSVLIYLKKGQEVGN